MTEHADGMSARHDRADQAIRLFFETLHRARYQPLLEKVTGVVRFDLQKEAHTDHWLVRIDRGEVQVSREQAEAELVVITTPDLFRKVVEGEENAIAAILRGAITVIGNALLILRIERLFPGPPGSRGPRRKILERAGS